MDKLSKNEKIVVPSAKIFAHARAAEDVEADCTGPDDKDNQQANLLPLHPTTVDQMKFV